MTDEERLKTRDYQKNKYHNMTNEQKQKLIDYQREYHKKYYKAKKQDNEIMVHA